MRPISSIALGRTLQMDDQSLEKRIREQLNHPNFSGFFSDSDSDLIKTAEGVLSVAEAFSVSPISGHSVGAVAIGTSGKLYLGANMEFAGSGLSTTLHAEQSAVLNAWIHGELEITDLVISDVPCGHCRQFLCELSCSKKMLIRYPGAMTHLADLLPGAFGTTPLAGQGLMDSSPISLESVKPMENSLSQRALNAAQRSYAPYTNASEGFAIEGSNGHFYIGRTAESVAFNPGVTAIVCALNQRNLSSGRSFAIDACVHSKLATAMNCTYALSVNLMARISKTPVQQVLMERN